MEKLKDVTIDPEKLRQARGDRSLTDAAEAIGITKQRLWNYENGKGDPPSDVLIKLCLLYGKPIQFFSTADENFLQSAYIGY